MDCHKAVHVCDVKGKQLMIFIYNNLKPIGLFVSTPHTHNFVFVSYIKSILNVFKLLVSTALNIF